MTQIYRILFLLVSVTSLPAMACSCGGWPSAKTAWQSAPVVFLGSVVQENTTPDGRAQSVLAHVDEAFKGATRSQIITIDQHNLHCGPEFQLGARVVFYLYPTGKPDLWLARGCGRLRYYDDAGDDLLFLRRLPASAAGTRISGDVALYENDVRTGFHKVRSLPGVTVKVTSSDGVSVTLTTSSDGIFEWYGLPVGDYTVDIEVPKGMKIDTLLKLGRRTNPQDGKIQLAEGAGIDVSFALAPNTKIAGRVLDPDGLPMDGVEVSLRPIAPDHNRDTYVRERTSFGKFELEMMPPGQYYLVANSNGRITAREPFPTLYYPGTTDLKKAMPVTATEGGAVENLNFRVTPARKLVELVGRVVFSDGIPAPGAHVAFVDRAESHHEGVRSQQDGSFRIRIVEGTEGVLYAEMWAHRDNREMCPQFAAAEPEGSPKSVPVVVSASTLTEIILNLQVPSCKGWSR